MLPTTAPISINGFGAVVSRGFYASHYGPNVQKRFRSRKPQWISVSLYVPKPEIGIGAVKTVKDDFERAENYEPEMRPQAA